MDTIRFVGHVYPRGTLISASLPDIDWNWEEENIAPNFRTKITNSVINVECRIPRYETKYFVELLRRALDLARTAINLACFATGEGVTAVFEFAILPDGTPSTLRYHEPNLSGLVKSYNLQDRSSLNLVAQLMIRSPALFATLNDCIEAISVPHTACLNCGRVVDSIRRLIAPKLDGAAAWKKMQTALNVSASYQMFISQSATGPRHGDSTYISGTVTTEVVQRTWHIMDRYLEYLKRGNVALTAPDFPCLS